MELGDKVKEVTEAVGIKPCKGCKRRQETLNKISRRGFVGGTVVFLVLAKNEILTQAWSLASRDVPMEPGVMLGFMRQCNTILITELSRRTNGKLAEGKHLDRNSLFAAVASHREHFEPGSGGYEWMSRFTPGAGEDCLQSWKTKYVVVPESKDASMYGLDGYRLAVYNDAFVYITDETGWVYRAPMPATGIGNLASLASASAFPLAETVDTVGHIAKETWQTRLKWFFYARTPRLSLSL